MTCSKAIDSGCILDVSWFILDATCSVKQIDRYRILKTRQFPIVGKDVWGERKDFISWIICKPREKK